MTKSEICTTCQFKNPEGMKYCGNCGASLIGNEKTSVHPGTRTDHPERMINAELAKRFRKEGMVAEGQRRNVTVLFADMVEYTQLAHQIDDEDLYEVMQRFIAILVECIYRYDGMVDKITGDGIMGLFGAPISYENNAERALHASLDMHHQLKQLNDDIRDTHHLQLHMRIGVHSGTVIVGTVGSDLLMDYTAIGDTVNLANRLEGAAERGTTLVSEHVYNSTRMLFEFDPISDFKVKGYQEPITAYRLLGISTTPGRVRGVEGLVAPMVGRDRELQSLINQCRKVVETQDGQLILIMGEAGIGKTRLVTELIDQLHGVGIQILMGRTLTYRRSMTYWLFRDLVRTHLNIPQGASDQELSAALSKKLSALFPAKVDEILPYLEHMMSIPVTDLDARERLAQLEAGLLRRQIFVAMKEYILLVAQSKPLLILLDDLHWADEASLDLVEYLIDVIRSNALLVIGISRPVDEGILDGIETRATERLGQRYSKIQLSTLQPSESEQLLHELLTSTDLPVNLVDNVIEQASGVPFYMEEILRMMIDADVIFHDGQSWQVRVDPQAAKMIVPETLHSLILTRFDRLPSEYRRILQVASVIGGEFNIQLLKHVVNLIYKVDTEIDLGYLVDRAFIIPTPEGMRGEYVFRHSLTSEAIYSTLLRKDRKALHAKVGLAIEALYPNKIDENVHLLARHYSWSSLNEKALKYLIQAGERSARDYINKQTLGYYKDASKFLKESEHTPEQALKVFRGLGDVLLLIGDHEKARVAFESALQIVPKLDESIVVETASEFHRKIGTTYERQGDFESAIDSRETARKIIEDVGLELPYEQASIYSDIGWVYFRRGDLEVAEQYLTKSLAMIESTTHYGLIASIYNRLGGVYYQKDHLEQASNFVRKSLVLRQEMGDVFAVARSYNNLGLLGWKRGDWDNALESFYRSLEYNQKIGDVEVEIEILSNLGLLHLDKGDFEEAEANIKASLTKAIDIGHAYMEGIACLHYSKLFLMKKQWGTAMDYIHRSLNIFEELGVGDHIADLHTNLGEAWLGLGEFDKAESMGKQAIKKFAELTTGKLGAHSEERARSLRLLGRVALERSQYSEAYRLLKQSQQIFEAIGNSLEQARTMVFMAQVTTRRGTHQPARIILYEAKLIFEQFGASKDLADLDEFVTMNPELNGFSTP